MSYAEVQNWLTITFFTILPFCL